jgi:hypothetical protein
MRPHRLLLLGVAAAIGCAVQFQPGDYAGAPPLGEATDAGETGSGGANADATADAGEDGAASPKKRLLVFAGERDGTNLATSDVWSATIGDSGVAGDWEIFQPGVLRGRILTANVAEGRLFVAMAATERFVQHAAFEAGLRGPWKGTTAPPPPRSGFASVFAGSRLLALGGTNSDTEPYDDRIWIAPFDADAGAFAPLVESSTRLPHGMQAMRTVTYKDFVYLIGGMSAEAGQANRVYVARIDAMNGVGPVTATQSIVNPATGGAYTPIAPILCAVEGASGKGLMIVAGGVNNDVVLTSTIDEATGMLGPWEPAPRLPGPLRDAGCAVYAGFLHLIGGYATTSRTDRILRAPIGPDGKLGDWDISSGERLPAARSSIFAHVY